LLLAAALATLVAIAFAFASADAKATSNIGAAATSLDAIGGTVGSGSASAVTSTTIGPTSYSQPEKGPPQGSSVRYVLATAPVGSEVGAVFTRSTVTGTVPGVAPGRSTWTQCATPRAAGAPRGASAASVVNPVSSSPLLQWWLMQAPGHCLGSDPQTASAASTRHASSSSPARAHQTRSRRADPVPAQAAVLPRLPSWVATDLLPVRSYVPGHVYATRDPLGSGREVAAFAIDNGDRPYADSQPRGDLQTGDPTHGPTAGDYYKPGSTSFTSIPVLIPSGLPLTGTHGNWFQWAQAESIAADQWGWSLQLTSFTDRTANHYALAAWYYNHSAPAWIGPKVDGRWHTAILQVHYATDDTGWIKLWWDGVPQTFQYGASAGTQTMSGVPTLLSPDGAKGWPLDIDSYRNRDSMPGTVTIYHGAPAIGPTYESVAGTLSSPSGP
jgi:Polysaccharide lyase